MDGLLSYRLATNTDYDFEGFYKIKCDPENIKWGGFVRPPDKNSFRVWYEQKLDDNQRDIYLVFWDNNIVAFFYIDYLNEKLIEDTSGVLSEYMGKGIGTYIIRIIDDIAIRKGIIKHIAWISENNQNSAKRYIKLGYRKTLETDVREMPLLGGKHIFYKWEKDLL